MSNTLFRRALRLFAGCVVTLMTATAHADISTGLLGWYGFEGNTNDSSGNARNGSPTALTYATGHIGQAGSFNNATSLVEVPSLAGLLPGGSTARTVAFWVSPSSTVDNGNIVSWGQLANNQRFSILMQGGGRLDMIGQFNDPSSNFNLPANTWTHVAVTYSGADALRFYVNGTLQTTVNAVTLNTDASRPLRIGVNAQGSNTEFFGGLIDEVRVYDRILAAADVTELYNSTAVAGAVSASTAAIPTLSEWGILLLGGLIGAALFLQRRRSL